MSVIKVGDTFDQMKYARLRHQLAEHPLMTVDSFAALAMRLDPAHVRFHEGERSVATNMSTMLTNDPTRQGLRNTLDNLHRAKAFVQLVNVRSDPAFRVVIDELLDEVVPFLPPRDRQLLNRDAAAFLASPGSVTPFHLDHEQNFLCHISGPKTFYVWDHLDRSVISERALETFYHGRRLRGTVYEPSMQAKAHAVELQPGDCLYMPMGSPHAASTGNDITVTISILMNTQTSYDLVETYRANSVMRRLGLSPAPVGDNQVRDSLKRHTLGAVRRVRNLARGRSTERRLQWY
jgi:hypothetical protein